MYDDAAMSRAVHRPSGNGPMTLRDVAKRVGIHPATASRALNDSTRHLVSAATATRVTEAAREMGYTPNSIARSLKTSRSLTVGVILPDLTNPVFPPMVRGIEDALAPAGFTALIANTDNDQVRARSVIQALRLRQVDGWISAVATLHDHLFTDPEPPLVLLNRQDEDRTPAVVGDDRDGIAKAIAHLVGLGHRRIAYVAGPQALSTGSARCAAYVDVMTARGLSVDRALVGFGESFSEQEGARVLAALFDAGGEFTAVIAGNDLMALGCYETLAGRGLRCPEDISVIGFNDMHFADRFAPPLTTVRIPHHEMGRRAAEQLLAQIGGASGKASPIVLPVELVVRRSTAEPARRGH
jgi:LacI family transcriptional regulator